MTMQQKQLLKLLMQRKEKIDVAKETLDTAKELAKGGVEVAKSNNSSSC